MVLIIGGRTPNGITSSVIQLGDNCTDDIPNLPVGVSGHSSTVLNGDIVTCGGENGNSLDTCYSLTPGHGGEWREVTNLRLPYQVAAHTIGTGIRVKTYYKIYHLAPFSYFLMGKRFADFMNKIEKKCAKP